MTVRLALATLGAAFLLWIGVLAGCGQTTPGVSPDEVARAVSPEIREAAIRDHLEHLTGVSPVSLPGGVTTISERGSERGRKAAAEYMVRSFERAGASARILEFTSGSDTGFNVEATLEGSGGEKHLWVTAHMDSVGNAGANDNASGLVMLLLAARALEGLDLEHTVHFVAYDLEEEGLIGSNRYVNTEVLSVRAQGGDEAVIGNINADMVGYEEDDPNAFVMACDRAGSLDEALARASSAIDPPIALGEGCPANLEGRTDDQIFREAGFPAVALLDGSKADGYPCYHKTCDTADKLNVAYLRSMIRMVATASALLASPEME